MKLYRIIGGKLFISARWSTLTVEEGQQLAAKRQITGLINVAKDHAHLAEMTTWYRHQRLADGRAIPDVTGLVDEITAHVAAGGRVCICCLAGVNRSAFVAALATMRLLNVNGKEAISLVRQGREGALQNAHFVEYLEALPAPGDARPISLPRTKHGRTRLNVYEDLDQRTSAARKARELIAGLESDLGGDLTIAQRELCKRAALAGALAEDAEVRWLRGEPMAVPDWTAIANAQRRLLLTLGLERRARDINAPVSYNDPTRKIIDAIEARNVVR